MSAEPFTHVPGPVDRPRTVGAIRAMLPPELRERFQDALDAAAPEELFSLVAQWAAVAQTTGDTDARAAALAVRAGNVDTHEIGDVFPALAGTL